MKFGDKLKQARNNKNLTQEQLANIVGVAKSTITGYEKGTREPNLLVLLDLAKALTISADELLGNDIPKPDIQVQNSDEASLLNNYRALNERGKDYIHQTMVMAMSVYKTDVEFAKDDDIDIEITKELRDYLQELKSTKKGKTLSASHHIDENAN